MNQAKGIINLKKGIIELEGPVDFVRRHLDRHLTGIARPRGSSTAIAASAAKAGTPPGPKRKARRLKAQKSGLTPCAAAIGCYLESGFFDHPRSFRDVREHLANNRVVCGDSVVRANLRRLVSAGSVSTTGVAGALRYQTSGRS